MEEYLVVLLPSFISDAAKHEVDNDKLEKFLSDLAKAPKKIKNAHPLHGPLSPLWSAHFNSNVGNLVTLYFICDGETEKCFLPQSAGIQVYTKYQEGLTHACDGKKRIYMVLMERHEIYQILD